MGRAWAEHARQTRSSEVTMVKRFSFQVKASEPDASDAPDPKILLLLDAQHNPVAWETQ